MKHNNIIITLIFCLSFSSGLSFSMEQKNDSPSLLLDNAKNNNWDYIKKHLPEYNGDINVTNDDGFTLLHLAILAGQTECVEMLINKNANVNIHSTKGKALDQPKNRSWQNRIYTPLHCAAHIGNMDIINLLFKNGADINSTYQNDESTPLHLAAWFDHPDCVKFLIDMGADMSKTNLAGSTPVHSAAWRGRPECLKILINKGAAFEDKNSTGTGNTPLYLAAKAGSLECLRILMEHSPDKNFIVNLRCAGEGITPVQIATNMQNVQCVWDLIINGADINATLKSNTYADIIALAQNNKPLKKFIQHIQYFNTAPRYDGKDTSCLLCNKAYQNNDVILTLTSCKDSFHGHCFKKYAIKEFCTKNPNNPLIKNKPREEAEFLLLTKGYTWDDIKSCPKCYKPADLIQSAELTLFFK